MGDLRVWLVLVAGAMGSIAPAHAASEAEKTQLEATPAGQLDRIAKVDGTVLVGTILQELKNGYLFRTTGDKTFVVLFADIADISRVSAPASKRATPAAAPAPRPAPPQPQPQPEPPPPPPPEPTPEVQRSPLDSSAPVPVCVPDCGAGLVCDEGRCVAACQPPCRLDQVCTPRLVCEDKEEAPAPVSKEEADLSGKRAGLHAGIETEFVLAPNGHGPSSCSSTYSDTTVCYSTTVGAGVALLGNYSLGLIEIRGLAQLQWLIADHLGLVFGLELRLVPNSWLRFGLGARLGIMLNTAGLGDGPFFEPWLVGGHIVPLAVAFGDQKNIELGLVFGVQGFPSARVQSRGSRQPVDPASCGALMGSSTPCIVVAPNGFVSFGARLSYLWY